MALDLVKCLKSSLLPSVLLILAEILDSFIMLVLINTGTVGPGTSSLCIFGLITLFLPLAILVWSGYRVVKKQGMDITGGAVTGALTGIICGLLFGFIQMIMVLILIPTMVSELTSGSSDGQLAGSLNDMQNTSGPFLIIGGIFNLIILVVMGGVIGMIFGAIGAFFAKKKIVIK